MRRPVPSRSSKLVASTAQPRQEHEPLKRLEPRYPSLPVAGVIDGTDAVMDDAELVDPGSSWNPKSFRRGKLVGMAIAPDRLTHEAYLERLNRYCDEVKREPSTLEAAIKAKTFSGESMQGPAVPSPDSECHFNVPSGGVH